MVLLNSHYHIIILGLTAVKLNLANYLRLAT